MNVTACLLYLLPDAQFTVWNNDPQRIIWNDPRPQPTLAQLQAAWPLVQAQDLADKQAEATAAANATALDANIVSAFTELRAFRDRTSTTLSVAQNIAILKTICRVLIWIGRLLLKRFDGTA